MYKYTKDGYVVLQGQGDPTRGYSDSKEAIAMRLKEGAKAPSRATDGDAGADLFAYLGVTTEEAAFIELKSGEQLLVDTGVSLKIPKGYAGIVMAKSSFRSRRITSWGDGLIDAGYRDSIKVVLCNMSAETIRIKHGEKIAQLVIQAVKLVNFVDIWNDTERGIGGFGSTGK